MVSVLIVEHDPAVAELARRYLAREGFAVRLAGTSGEAAAAFAEAGAGGYSPDAVVLDLTMPGLRPREIRRALCQPAGGPGAPPARAGRGRPALVRPLVCLAGPGGLRPREVGVPESACLRRPFGPRNLVARVRAALETSTRAGTRDTSSTGGHGTGRGRGGGTPGDTGGTTGALGAVGAGGALDAGGASCAADSTGGAIDALGAADAQGALSAADAMGVPGAAGTVGDRNAVLQPFADVALTATERDLLGFLLANPGRVFTRERLLAALQGTAGSHFAGPGTGEPGSYLVGPGGGHASGQRGRRRAPAGPRAIDVYVAQLRAKLGARSPIRTVRGVGYSAQP